jgi:NADPH:quinone reductase-like Zn-dependent oxidoreductase
VVFFISRSTAEDLAALAELLEAGTVTPCVERTYPLTGAADALRHLGEGHARGKLVVSV